jgi:hypothetical protein
LRQYAQGEVSPNQSFYFRGPESKLHLRAQNLETFLQMADGVDDDTCYSTSAAVIIPPGSRT